MKYYLLGSNLNYKSCYLENANSLKFKKQYYNGELLDDSVVINVSVNSEVRNKYLPLKNIMHFWGCGDSFAVDEKVKKLLEEYYFEFFNFKKIEVTDSETDRNFYLLFFRKFTEGFDEERSVLKFDSRDSYVITEDAVLYPVFKFNYPKSLTFADETFKKFVEDNHIEGWMFREAFEKM